jgi:diguanylate cyclase (GGDEF)-like protein
MIQSNWIQRAAKPAFIMNQLSLNRTIAFCIVLVLLTLVGGSWFLLEHMRQTALKAADATLQNAALIVESVVNRQLLQVDGALVSLPALFATVAKEGQGVNAQSAGRLLSGLNFQTFAFRDLVIIDQGGGIWASARPNPWNGSFPVDILDLASHSGGAARVAGPLRNPVTGDWVLLVVRPITVPSVGALNAIAEVPLPIMTSLFSAVGEIPDLRVSIERHDGQLLVSQPYDEIEVGKRQLAIIGQNQANGHAFILPRKLIRAPTLGVVRTTLYPDVIIVLTLNLKTAMADWRRDRNRMIVLVAIAVVLLSGLALTLGAARRLRKRADTERSKAQATLNSAIESMSDGFVMWDAEDRLVTCNQQFRHMYQVSADFIFPGATFRDIVRGGAYLGQYPQATGNIEAFVQETIEWHHHNQGPIERELPNGRWALITERPTSDGGSVGIRTDITDLKRALSSLAVANEEVQQQNVALRERDRALHIQNVLFDAALNNMSQGLLMIDRNQRLIVYNMRFLALFRIDPSSFSAGLLTNDIFAKMTAADGMPSDMLESLYLKQRGLADARQSGTFVVSGEPGLSIAISQRPIADGGWVATYEDVSEQRRAEEHIRFAAHHDALTKLPNRVLFRIRLDEMISNLAHRDTGLALLYLDLDRFKHVNDTLGHPIGDALLEAAGRRLLSCLREGDIVARLGGDEFAIAYVSPDLPAAAEELGQRIIVALSTPYKLAGHTVIVGASVGIALTGVGIALTDGGPMDADTLLKNADMALYQAKARGRGVCSLFEADMERQLLSRLAIEEDLRDATDRDEFELLYQPLWDLNSNRIAGFEALIRWNHPVRGTVFPGQFIQIAEETGLIRSIGRWVLNKACADAMKLPDDIKVAINLSVAQFEAGDIVDIVSMALDSSGLPANRLELEITETTLLKNNETTLALLFRLHALGLRIALDDFGTGYSSLSYLRTFPFDKIKIDQSFVREMATRADCAAIVSSIVALANKLNITTTAEGIETVDQLDLIRETGCTEAQGYLFSVPRPLREVLDYFLESSNASAEVQNDDVGKVPTNYHAV